MAYVVSTDYSVPCTVPKHSLENGTASAGGAASSSLQCALHLVKRHVSIAESAVDTLTHTTKKVAEAASFATGVAHYVDSHCASGFTK